MKKITVEVEDIIFDEVLLAIETWIDDFYSGPDRAMIKISKE